MKSFVLVQRILLEFTLLSLSVLLVIDLITTPVLPTAFLSFRSPSLSLALSADPSTNRVVLSATFLLAIFLLRARSFFSFFQSSSVRTTPLSATDVSFGLLGLFLWASTALSRRSTPSPIHYAIRSSLIALVALGLWGLFFEVESDAVVSSVEMVTEKSPLLPPPKMPIRSSNVVGGSDKNTVQQILLWVVFLLMALVSFGASGYLTWLLGVSPATLLLIPAVLSVALFLCSIALSRSALRFLSDLTLLISFYAVLSYTVQVSGAPVCGVWDPLSEPYLRDSVLWLCAIAKVLYYASWTMVLVLFCQISSHHWYTVSSQVSEPPLREKHASGEVDSVAV